MWWTEMCSSFCWTLFKQKKHATNSSSKLTWNYLALVCEDPKVPIEGNMLLLLTAKLKINGARLGNTTEMQKQSPLWTTLIDHTQIFFHPRMTTHCLNCAFPQLGVDWLTNLGDGLPTKYWGLVNCQISGVAHLQTLGWATCQIFGVLGNFKFGVALWMVH